VPATAEQLGALHEALGRFWRAVERVLIHPPPPAWRDRFATAVGEIGANIVRHAHPPGALPGTMQMRLRAYPDRVEGRFTDQGGAYAPPPPAPDAPAGAAEGAEGAEGIDAIDVMTLAEGGYGLALVRRVVDELDYTRTPGGGNEWRLVKRL
jgi:anti-sigma regulatory factor (Ser/Thr protein kinase)